MSPVVCGSCGNIAKLPVIGACCSDTQDKKASALSRIAHNARGAQAVYKRDPNLVDFFENIVIVAERALE